MGISQTKESAKMKRELVHDPMFLAMKSRPAVREDIGIAQDLLDTLMFHRETCVGMAANMIGKSVRIIAFSDKGRYVVMCNPEIVSRTAPFEAEESCLSLLGGARKTTRYKTIRVKFQNASFMWETKTYTDFTAQIIQHEVDHCNGVLI